LGIPQGVAEMKKKTRKKPITPYSRIVSALRMLWLRSRERQLALKLAGNTCKRCGRKASKAKGREFKVEVHHTHGVGNWNAVVMAIKDQLLVGPDKLEVLCKECHAKEHAKECATCKHWPQDDACADCGAGLTKWEAR
jgi:hypothetical protein